MNASLYLFPAEAFAAPPDLSMVQHVLRQLGVTGQALEEHRFLVGEHFFRHITFAGCSPSMHLQPPQAGSLEFTHISVNSLSEPRLTTTRLHARPRCPHCRQRLQHWKSNIDDWQRHPDNTYVCATCEQPSSIAALNWGRYAACGRLLIEIHQVFPGEAMPGDILIAELEKVTATEWRFAWADSMPALSETK